MIISSCMIVRTESLSCLKRKGCSNLTICVFLILVMDNYQKSNDLLIEQNFCHEIFKTCYGFQVKCGLNERWS